MGCAISTMLPAGQGAVTLDLKLAYLRPLSVQSGTISAEGIVIKLGPPDRLCRRLCPRPVRQSRSARDRDLFDDRAGSASEINEAFCSGKCYYMIANIL
jgi:acyl-coenzyme A thioesterase PaaI-like protein